MNDIIEIYDEYRDLGIKTRKITQGCEFNLVREFIQFRKNEFKSSTTNKLAIFIEPKINNSYPDIVFVEYNPDCFENWNIERNNLSAIEFKVLYYIYIKEQINANEIVSQLGISWKDTMLSIEKLYDAKLIKRSKCNWCIRNKDIFGVKKIEAVEAKINKLDNVFQQALVNKSFASESYVLSNLGQNVFELKIDRYEKFGIGFYSLNHNKGFEVLIKPKKVSIPVSFSSIYFNEWIGRVLMMR
ncbi:MAG: winged helix-turn-helix transcriptional regulator [Firmicutes bacterium]|nr:winged helix-turn-helix transcriptional regulator [Bacillota bacterium]